MRADADGPPRLGWLKKTAGRLFNLTATNGKLGDTLKEDQ
jgi:hypothetical protein